MKTSLTLTMFILALVAFGVSPSPADDAAGVGIKVTDDAIDFLVGKELIGRYHKGPKVAKPYFWPLNGPGGVAVTRGWPMVDKQPGGTEDHIHQKSAWFCHGDVIPEGIPLKDKIKGVTGVDFWSENKGHGNIVCVHADSPKTDKNHGQVTTRNKWTTASDEKILDESRTIHLYDLGGARLFVFDIDLHASVCPITFGDTKEGSMGIRINDTIREAKAGGKLENAEGKVGEKACWGQQSAWCDYSGMIDGKMVGLAVLDDASNPYKACWHSRGYGLMAANPFGRGKAGFPAMKDNPNLVKLAKDEHLKLRYGILIHPGDAKEGKVAEHYQRFLKSKN